MRRDRILLVSVVGMAFALMTMLVCLALPSARMVGVFLGLGLPVAIVSVVVFALYVLRDLRARRVL